MMYAPSEMVGTKRTSIRGVENDLHSIYTSHVERHESGQLRVPAAMAAGVTSRLMSFEGLYDEVTAA